MPRKQLKPAIKLRRKFASLIELCKNKILTAPPQTSGTGLGDKLITVVIKWGLKDGKSGRMVPDLPEDFPTGVVVSRDDNEIVIRHNVVSLLKWFKAYHYVSYDAADLFAQRLPIMMMIAKMELGMERSVELLQQFEKELDDNKDSEYNDCIE